MEDLLRSRDLVLEDKVGMSCTWPCAWYGRKLSVWRCVQEKEWGERVEEEGRRREEVEGRLGAAEEAKEAAKEEAARCREELRSLEARSKGVQVTCSLSPYAVPRSCPVLATMSLCHARHRVCRSRGISAVVLQKRCAVCGTEKRDVQY